MTLINIDKIPQIILVAILVLVGSIQYTTLPSSAGYLLIIALYSFLALLYINSDIKIQAKKFYTALFLFIVVISVSGSIIHLSIDTSIRVLALLVITAMNLFIIPRIISFENFSYTLPRISLLILIVGLLPLLSFSNTILFLDLSFWSSSSIISFLPTITSIYSNPNTLGFVLFVGATLSFTELVARKSIYSLFIFISLIIGLVITNNRSGILAFIIAISLFIVYIIKGHKFTIIALVSGLVTTIVFLSALFGLLPGTASLTDVSLNGRRGLWTSSVNTFKNNPIVGYGLEYGGTHNSFIRMFAALGIFGGLSYLIIYLSIVFSNTKNIKSENELILTTLLTGMLYVQLFEGGTFIGVSIHSILISVFMGYFITGSVHEDKTK